MRALLDEEKKQITRFRWISILIWTVIISAFFTWMMINHKRAANETHLMHARASFEKDVAYRRWNAMHGGVYVPVSELAPPNPYLEVPNRDITSESGLKLTMMNPAYMTRQVSEMTAEKGAVLGHITSLNPIRPENAPDAWETEALRAFEAGVDEISGISEIDGKPYLRLMRPLMTEKACLKCHESGGYKRGDVRGGISVSIPYDSIKTANTGHHMVLIGGNLAIWLVGVAFIFFGTNSLLEAAQRQKTSHEKLARFNRVLEQSLNEIYIFESETLLFIEVSRGARTNLGYTMDELRRLTPQDLNPEFTADSFAELIAPLRSGEEESITFTTYHRRKDGSQYPVEAHLQLMAEEPSVFLAIILDITERQQATDIIQYQATYDALTDLPNRRLLMDRMDSALARYRRHGRNGAVLFIDLDHFKHVNDSLGHPIGDALLKKVAVRLKTGMRDEDTIARLGGDEFIVLLSELSKDPEEAATLAHMAAEKIRKILSKPYNIQNRMLLLTPSIGIAMLPMNDDTTSDIIKHADTAMYWAKEEGRNAIRFYLPSMQAVAEERLAMQNDLLQALRQEQFDLHFQPQMDATGKICGVEALLRWRHPTRGDVSPGDFIHIAEETGQILDIGDWVLKQGLTWLKTWSEEIPGSPPCRLSINVSPQQFKQVDFTKQIDRALAETGAKPEYLTLEFTEGVLIENLEETIDKIMMLKKLGIRFSIDDFGTGYSSLAYLKKLPIDEVKIDRTFVRDITIDPYDAQLVETVITLCKQLGLVIVAEGVETSEQLEYLQKKGCELYQGYYFSKPMPAEEFTQLLNDKT